jgi:hypothetical protein
MIVEEPGVMPETLKISGGSYGRLRREIAPIWSTSL